MPDPQLLTKQVNVEAITITGQTSSVRFNLQRGKIARIWGFDFIIAGAQAGSREYICLVRKSHNAARVATPKDLLWVGNIITVVNGINWGINARNTQVMFPKPYRTSGVTLQIASTNDTDTRGVLIIYYDIDDVMKGELVQSWEKNISKGRTRRTIAP